MSPHHTTTIALTPLAFAAPGRVGSWFLNFRPFPIARERAMWVCGGGFGMMMMMLLLMKLMMMDDTSKCLPPVPPPSNSQRSIA
ncbi:hypothetical protein F4820DRAFT_410665 [Hypoxylon rubiginosum]|uniref:Uncharacterized protein n=1 Tax=Hypoxylon rubiginosum TaxID=110542 RepID=A0ACB9Z9U5_9PEZI|nr:hypothetical protein F4820DRAFT_410665 [Hypoxylon rubiginosum]